MAFLISPALELVWFLACFILCLAAPILPVPFTYTNNQFPISYTRTELIVFCICRQFFFLQYTILTNDNSVDTRKDESHDCNQITIAQETFDDVQFDQHFLLCPFISAAHTGSNTKSWNAHKKKIDSTQSNRISMRILTRNFLNATC